MSTVALEGSDLRGTARGATAARWLDLIVLAAALPVFLLAGFPLGGYLAAAAGWLAGRGIKLAADRRRDRALSEADRKGALGYAAAATLGRVWLLALVILVTGLVERESGLAAAVLAAALVTAYLLGEGLGYLLSDRGEG